MMKPAYGKESLMMSKNGLVIMTEDIMILGGIIANLMKNMHIGCAQVD